MRCRLLAVILAVFLGLPAVADEVVCRADALGSVRCPAAPPAPVFGPMPRPGGLPQAREPVQGLDRVRARTRQPQGESFVPARRTRTLGGTVLREGGGASSCRPDTLGNLYCR